MAVTVNEREIPVRYMDLDKNRLHRTIWDKFPLKVAGKSQEFKAQILYEQRKIVNFELGLEILTEKTDLMHFFLS